MRSGIQDGVIVVLLFACIIATVFMLLCLGTGTRLPL